MNHKKLKKNNISFKSLLDKITIYLVFKQLFYKCK